MLYYLSGVLFYFVYDTVKSKIVRVFWYRSSLKLIKYTNDWHDKHRNGYIIRILDYIILDNYF